MVLAQRFGMAFATWQRVFLLSDVNWRVPPVIAQSYPHPTVACRGALEVHAMVYSWHGGVYSQKWVMVKNGG